MRRVSRRNRLAVVAALGLSLAGLACNGVGNEPKESEAVIQGTGIEYVNTKIADGNAAEAKLTFAVRDRNQSNLSTSTLNAVEFLTLTASYTSPFVGTSTTNLEGVFYLVGSTGNVLLIGIPEITAGDLDAAHFHFEGRDNLGRHVSWDVDIATVISP